MPSKNQELRKYLSGSASSPEMSYADIGREIGIHRNSVADIEERALQKLRMGLEMRGYKLEDFFK
jgi:DNA-directed RNA polymerase sigma subunit (sigma70/sigma32)